MDLELADKTAIVVGGSRGIGKAIGRALAREGASVALVARHLPATQEAAKDIASETGSAIEAFAADTGESEEVKRVVREIVDRFGRIDILVNCAAQPGGQSPVPTLETITEEQFWADMNVKVMGYLRTAREVAPLMKQQRWGRIINISGLAARRSGSIIGSMRNVSVAAMTKNLADQLGPDGVNVICVHPGNTRTEQTEAMAKRAAAEAGVSVDEIEARWAKRNVIRHMVTAQEVADIVTFLASPRARAITGDSIAAGGGDPGGIYY